MPECQEWSEGSTAERMMISKCVNWMWRWSCACVCAAWLIGLPLARHFHYLIAWKGRRGDCRRLAVWAKRMDLECISIGSKAPAVGGCPRPLGLFMRAQVSCATSSLGSPLPGITLLSHSPHWKAPSNCTGAHTGSGSESSPYLDVYREQWFATRPAPAGPHCSTSLSVIGAPAHLISPPWEGHLSRECLMFPEPEKWCKSPLES